MHKLHSFAVYCWSGKRNRKFKLVYKKQIENDAAINYSSPKIRITIKYSHGQGVWSFTSLFLTKIFYVININTQQKSFVDWKYKNKYIVSIFKKIAFEDECTIVCSNFDSRSGIALTTVPIHDEHLN